MWSIYTAFNFIGSVVAKVGTFCTERRVPKCTCLN